MSDGFGYDMDSGGDFDIDTEITWDSGNWDSADGWNDSWSDQSYDQDIDLNNDSDAEVEYEYGSSEDVEVSRGGTRAGYSRSDPEYEVISYEDDDDAEVEYESDDDVDVSRDGTRASYGYEYDPDRVDEDEHSKLSPTQDYNSLAKGSSSDDGHEKERPKRKQTFVQWLFGIEPDDEEEE